MSERREHPREQEPSARPKSRADRQAETRDNLLDAALEVFIERGFHGASVEAIARHAGYTKGAVYANFAGKGELFLAVAQRRIEQAVQQAEAEVEEHENGKVPDPDPIDTDTLFEIKWAMLALEAILYAIRESPELHRGIAELYRHVDKATATQLEHAGAVPGESLTMNATARSALHEGLMLRRLADPERISPEYALRIHRSVFDPAQIRPWNVASAD